MRNARCVSHNILRSHLGFECEMPAHVQGWPGIQEDRHCTGTKNMWPSFYNRRALCPSYAIPNFNALEHGGSVVI